MTKLTFATNWTDPVTGQTYAPDETADIKDGVARVLLWYGTARLAPEEGTLDQDDPSAIHPESPESADPPAAEAAGEEDPAPAEEPPTDSPADAPQEIEPATEAEPAGPVESAPAKRRSRAKEVAADG